MNRIITVIVLFLWMLVLYISYKLGSIGVIFSWNQSLIKIDKIKSSRAATQECYKTQGCYACKIRALKLLRSVLKLIPTRCRYRGAVK